MQQLVCLVNVLVNANNLNFVSLCSHSLVYDINVQSEIPTSRDVTSQQMCCIMGPGRSKRFKVKSVEKNTPP